MQNLVNYAYTSQIEIRKDNVQVSDKILCFIGLWGLGRGGLFVSKTSDEEVLRLIDRFFARSNCCRFYNVRIALSSVQDKD